MSAWSGVGWGIFSVGLLSFFCASVLQVMADVSPYDEVRSQFQPRIKRFLVIGALAFLAAVLLIIFGYTR